MKKSLLILFFILIISLLCSCTPSNKTSIVSSNREKVTKKEEKQEVPKQDNAEKDSVPAESKPETKMVIYKGPVEHIFFHPLVIYPKLAFDGDRMSKGYDEWFVTVKEFNSIIQSLYDRNYLLIKMSDLFATTEINGKKQLIKKQLTLPEGKKPLILSVDDINYYSYMHENGNAYKLIIDSKGNTATYSKDPAGKEVISEENEIVPILNQFVLKHPDFSLNGAKGILALTGYEGIFGYRTNDLNSASYSSEKEEVSKVIIELKKDGWEFASHGYGHLNTRTISLNTLERDTDRWLKEVEPLIGDTNIYIYPFGSSVLPNDPKFKFLEDAGFNIFCSVGPQAYLSVATDYAMMDRVHIDGMALEQQRHIVDRFFDSQKVLDSERFAYKK